MASPDVVVSSPEPCAEILRALGEPARLQILRHLAAGPSTVAGVAAALGLRHYQASRHLAALATIGVVRQERRGRSVVSSLATAAPELDLGCCTLRLEASRTSA